MVGKASSSFLFLPSIFYSISYWVLPVKKFGDMIRAVYRRANNTYGKSLAKEGEKYGARGVTEFFPRSTSSMSWGGMELEELSDSKASFKIQNIPVSSRRGR